MKTIGCRLGLEKYSRIEWLGR